MPDSDLVTFDEAISAHDARLAARGLAIWVGNEPTFTDRYAQTPEWLNSALGPDKHQRALGVLAAIASELPGAAVLRCIGRQYPGEPLARWSYGVYAWRDGAPLWLGPPDPCLTRETAPPDLGAFHLALEAAFQQRSIACRRFETPGDRRLVFARDAAVTLPDTSADELHRSSVHAASIPESGLADDLARGGVFLLVLGSISEDGAAVASVDLPLIAEVERFCELLACVSEAAREAQLGALVLRGYPPPVDSEVTFTTVTPDPAVIEVNMAPYPDVATFLAQNRACYRAASAAGLSPYRLYYNGAVADSGGAGHITLGGPANTSSPFFRVAQVLPRLVRYVVRHPALSYLFAHEHIGPSGQSVRADERGADALSELHLALTLLSREEALAPSTLWLGLQPCLTDPAGNPHRAELNVEKLWNPFHPGRGQLGVVEFRAFRMQQTPERAAALAALLRAVVAMLMSHDPAGSLTDWGATLHERFALPLYLEQDLKQVLEDLDHAGLGLGATLVAELESDTMRDLGEVELEDCTLTIRKALEFWPLLGDATFQHGGSRLVDSSTSRVELALRPRRPDDASALGAWRVQAHRIDVPLRSERDARGPLRVFGLRYRSFSPAQGLHPTLPAQAPVRLYVVRDGADRAREVTLHEWEPSGAAYDGLPADLETARRRRLARCVARSIPASEVPARSLAPAGALREYALDLRYLPSPI